ncbi:MAG: hypothetical protein JJU32_00840 [Phormidium sp. BM_Day4_Bin.17]|nr:hypothetical protein [Phormidium sp. BM_Day4_Bin.17]UCJ11526.1 MAG: hypothetical protein JWS08_17480 [Phormidium sp. PBR-2020]
MRHSQNPPLSSIEETGLIRHRLILSLIIVLYAAFQIGVFHLPSASELASSTLPKLSRVAMTHSQTVLPCSPSVPQWVSSLNVVAPLAGL